MRDRKLSETAEEMKRVWQWYKRHAYIDKADAAWETISCEATKLSDEMQTELGRNMVHAALKAMSRE